MKHWCRIYGAHKANEKFSGGGHKNHICKLCSSRPLHEIQSVDHEREIRGFFQQHNISRKNIRRLKELQKSNNPTIRDLASAVLAVAAAKPHKRRRLKFLARHHREIMDFLEEVGLIMPRTLVERELLEENYYESEKCLQRLFDKDMDNYRAKEGGFDASEIERLLSEYSEMLEGET